MFTSTMITAGMRSSSSVKSHKKIRLNLTFQQETNLLKITPQRRRKIAIEKVITFRETAGATMYNESFDFPNFAAH